MFRCVYGISWHTESGSGAGLLFKENEMGQMIFIFYFVVLTFCGALILLNIWGV